MRGEKRSYLLLFRELTDRDTLELNFTEPVQILETVISNTAVTASAQDDRVSVTLSAPRSYALLEVKIG